MTHRQSPHTHSLTTPFSTAGVQWIRHQKRVPPRLSRWATYTPNLGGQHSHVSTPAKPRGHVGMCACAVNEGCNHDYILPCLPTLQRIAFRCLKTKDSQGSSCELSCSTCFLWSCRCASMSTQLVRSQQAAIPTFTP